MWVILELFGYELLRMIVIVLLLQLCILVVNTTALKQSSKLYGFFLFFILSWLMLQVRIFLYKLSSVGEINYIWYAVLSRTATVIFIVILYVANLYLLNKKVEVD